MATWQRRRGQKAYLYERIQRTSTRGNITWEPDINGPTQAVRVAESHDRSSQAELVGQQVIEVRQLIIKTHLTNPQVWGMVFFDGQWWDIESPPAYRHGTRHTRHWTVKIARRPDNPMEAYG